MTSPRTNSYGARILADTELDPPVCVLCKNPATRFYIVNEHAGFYDEYSLEFIAMLCDTCSPMIMHQNNPIYAITLDELRIMKVMRT